MDGEAGPGAFLARNGRTRSAGVARAAKPRDREAEQQGVSTLTGSLLISNDCLWLQELDAAVTPYTTPGAIGQPATSDKTNVRTSKVDGEIWEKDEVPQEPQYYDHDDPRPEPK